MTFASASYDADAAIYFAAIATAGSSISAANKTAVNSFIVGCKADGIWTAIKASCLLAGPNDLTGALVPLVGSAPTNINFVSGDHARTTGLLGNGTTKRIDTNRANDADPQDNAHIYCYVTTAHGSGSHIIMGTANATGGRCMRSSGGTSFQRYLNSAISSIAKTTTTGGFGLTRSTTPGATSMWGSATDSFSIATTTPLTTDIHVFGSDTATNFNGRISFYSIGENIDLSLLDARIVTLMSALT